MSKLSKKNKIVLSVFGGVLLAAILFNVVPFLMKGGDFSSRDITKAQIKQAEANKISKVKSDLRREMELIDGYGEIISLAEIYDEGGTFRVWIKFLIGPESIEDVKAITDGACILVRSILTKHDITNKAVSVWAKKDESGGRVRVYGRTFQYRAGSDLEFKIGTK